MYSSFEDRNAAINLFSHFVCIIFSKDLSMICNICTKRCISGFIKKSHRFELLPPRFLLHLLVYYYRQENYLKINIITCWEATCCDTFFASRNHVCIKNWSEFKKRKIIIFAIKWWKKRIEFKGKFMSFRRNNYSVRLSRRIVFSPGQLRRDDFFDFLANLIIPPLINFHPKMRLMLQLQLQLKQASE